MEDARYTDEEARIIFERAAEMQESSARSLVRADEGYSLAELQEIADEVGIQPAHVAAAAAELQAGPGPVKRLPFTGVPATIQAARTVQATVTDREWEAMVMALRGTFKRNGHVSQFGEVREWNSGNHLEGEAVVRVRVSPEAEGTRIRLSQSMKVWEQITVAVPGSFLAITLFVAALALFGSGPARLPGFTAFMAGTSLAFFGLFRGMARFLAKRQVKAFGETLSKLSDLARLETGGSTDEKALQPPDAEPEG